MKDVVNVQGTPRLRLAVLEWAPVTVALLHVFTLLDVGPVDDDTAATVIRRFYDLGVYPDWWKLEPMTSEAGWQKACAAIRDNDPNVRGIVVLGLEASEAALIESFSVAARFDLVKGFAVGRTIFADAAKAYMTGNITPEAAVRQMAERYSRLCALWDDARRAGEKAA